MLHKRTVQLLLIDGTASGRIQAKLDNWTGVAYRIPRMLLSESRDRIDLSYSGVYFLIGRDEETDELVAYIGQSSVRKGTEDSVIRRCGEHNRDPGKDFYNDVIFFTTTTDDFGPTELCYLENSFWKLADEAQRCRLKNGNEPSSGNVTEAKQAELDRYIENARVLLWTLGYPILEPKTQTTRAGVEAELYELALPKFQVAAKGMRTAEGFVVLKGSTVNAEEKPSISGVVKKLRSQLKNSGKLLVRSAGVLELTEDQLFPSPSAAGNFVCGRSCNGWVAWVNGNGQTLDQAERGAA